MEEVSSADSFASLHPIPFTYVAVEALGVVGVGRFSRQKLLQWLVLVEAVKKRSRFGLVGHLCHVAQHTEDKPESAHARQVGNVLGRQIGGFDQVARHSLQGEDKSAKAQQQAKDVDSPQQQYGRRHRKRGGRPWTSPPSLPGA